MMIRRIVAILIAVLLTDTCIAEIVYTNVADIQIAGSWEFAESNAILVHPNETVLDLNRDGLFDIELSHHYIAREHRLKRESVDLLETAQRSQRETLAILKDVRLVTLGAADDGVYDADALSAAQANIDNALHLVDRLAGLTNYNGRLLLDGSAGMTGISSHRDVEVLHVADTAQQGNYAIHVDTAAERAAALTSAYLDSGPISQDETLTVNGVTVDLFRNMTATQVRDRVNQFTDQTGVTAHITQNGVDAGKLRLTTTTFGEVAELHAISNVDAATANSTSIGTSLIHREGTDTVVNIAGTQFNGQGNTVTADSGPARGLSLSIHEDTTLNGDNNHLTVSGDVGTVTVIDNSLSFVLHPSETESVSIALRTMRTGSLGLRVTGNQFNNLAEIDVTSASKAQDALAIIDAAVDTLQAEITKVDSLVKNFFVPYGEAFVEGFGLGEVAIHNNGVEILYTGSIIGPDSMFSDEMFSLGSLEFDGRESGFVAIRFKANDRYHYGWIRAELAEDESLIVRDYAFESIPDKSIRAGFVPEPSSMANVILCGVLVCCFARRKCTARTVRGT